MGNIGKKIYGYCNGYFGRDDYEDKIIVYETPNSICCIYVDKYNCKRFGDLTVANFNSPQEKQKYINEWSVETPEEEW